MDPGQSQALTRNDQNPIVFTLQDSTVLTVNVKWLEVCHKFFRPEYLEGVDLSWQLELPKTSWDDVLYYILWVQLGRTRSSILCANLEYYPLKDVIRIEDSRLLDGLVEFGGRAIESGKVHGLAPSGLVGGSG